MKILIGLALFSHLNSLPFLRQARFNLSSLVYPIRFLIILGLVILPALAKSQAQTIPLLDGMALSPLSPSSPFIEYQGISHFRLQDQMVWNPTIDKKGSDTALIRSSQSSQYLYSSIADQAVIKIGITKTDQTFYYQNPNQFLIRLESKRHSIPFGFLYHILPQNPSPIDVLIDFKNPQDLDYSFGLKWQGHGGLKNLGGMQLQLWKTFKDEKDQYFFKDFQGHAVEGLYSARYQSLNLSTEFRPAFHSPLLADSSKGIWSMDLHYNWSLPSMPLSEYSFTDSSQSAQLGFVYREGSHLSYLGYHYGEGRTRTSGYRIPSGSEGKKRFHYALNSTSHQELKIISPPWVYPKNEKANHGIKLASTIGMAGREFSFTSAAPDFAIDKHLETLSYNRLGLSFIADLYGGFSRNSEILSMDGKIRQIELSTNHKLEILRTITLNLTLPLSFSEVDFSLEGQTLNQGLFSTKIDRSYSYGIAGDVLSLWPNLEAEYTLGFWDAHRLKLQGEFSQIIFLWNSIAQINPGPQSPGQTNPNSPTPVETNPNTPNPELNPSNNPSSPNSQFHSKFPLWSNGFFAKLGITLDF